MIQSNQKVCSCILIAFFFILLGGCAGPLNIKEDDQKYSELDEASVKRGKILYQDHCLQCHGESGKGDGPKAAELSLKTPDLRDEGLHITRYGMRAIVDFPHYSPEAIQLRMKHGKDSMPTFKEQFTEQEQKDITNYILNMLHL